MLNRVLLCVLALLMIGTASAESIVAGDYNISFKLERPHEVVILFNTTPPSEDPAGALIRTSDGRIMILKTGTDLDAATTTYLDRLIITNNITASFRIVDASLKNLPHEYVLYLGDEGIRVFSDLPLMDAIDFFKSLKIEKIEK